MSDPLYPFTPGTQIHSTHPLEGLNATIKRKTNMVGISPNGASITRLVGAMMVEQSEGWSLNRRYMRLERLETLCDTEPSAVAR